jgi:hypothetical protein
VFDLDVGPLTITLPDAGKRFMSMQVIDEDQYTPKVIYEAGSHTLSNKIGTRYVVVAVRTLIDPANPKDVEAVHALQNGIKVDYPGGPGKFEVPQWDLASQKKVREALLVLASTLPDTKLMFGPKSAVEPVRRLIGAASAWGGNPEKDALYLTVTPPRTTARPPTGSTSRTCRSMAFGQSACKTRKGISSRTAKMPILSTTSRRRATRTVRSASSSAAATAGPPTAYPSRMDGITSCGCIAPVKKF